MDPKISSYLIGKRVAFNKPVELGEYKIGGAMADYAVSSLKFIMPIPDGIDFDHGSSFFVNPLTAIGMVERTK
jgi:NADPH:quinone reductase-like Zn-dependent oxidoreductase